MTSPSAQPNILWICTDQQRYDTIAALGNRAIRTPNLDRLCRQGVAFTHAYCQSPICTPSRSSFLTAKYPSTIAACRNGNGSFSNRAPLISKLMADRAYDCGLVGKLHIASPWHGYEKRVDDGYSTFIHSVSPHQGLSYGNEYGDWLRQKGVDPASLFHRSPKGSPEFNNEFARGYRTDIDVELHQTVFLTEKALEFMARPRQQPFFLSLNYHDPHPPFCGPDLFADRYERSALPPPRFRPSDLANQENLRDVLFQCKASPPSDSSLDMIARYYAMIELIDREVGKLLDWLEQRGQRENTLIVFTSDHGETLGDHGFQGKGCRFYEGLVRVPLVFSWPGVFRSEERVDDLVELIDIAPTLAEATGFAMESVHGRSLLPRLLRERPEEPYRPREFVRCEYYDTLNMNLPDTSKPHRPTYGIMYRDHRYKLSYYPCSDQGELFDLQEDPDEFDNLWASPQHQDRINRLIRLMLRQTVETTDLGSRQIGRY